MYNCTFSAKSKIRWEFGIVIDKIKIWEKSTIFNMLRILILHNNNDKKLLKNWKHCPISAEKYFFFVFSFEFPYIF